MALQRQIQAESEAKTAEPLITVQTEVVDTLTTGLNAKKMKLKEKIRREEARMPVSRSNNRSGLSVVQAANTSGRVG